MSKSSELYSKAKQAGKVKETNFLKLGERIEGKGVKSTGPHKVKFIKDRVVKGRDYHTKEEREEVEYTFEENGEEKIYRVPSKGGDGNLHYFVRNMANINGPNNGIKEGQEIVLEMKKTQNASGRIINIVQISVPEAPEEDIDEPDEQPEEEEEDEINTEDIPF